MTPHPPKMSGLQLLDVVYGLGACNHACCWIAENAHLPAGELWVECRRGDWLVWLADCASGWMFDMDTRNELADATAKACSDGDPLSPAVIRRHITWPMIQAALEASYG